MSQMTAEKLREVLQEEMEQMKKHISEEFAKMSSSVRYTPRGSPREPPAGGRRRSVQGRASAMPARHTMRAPIEEASQFSSPPHGSKEESAANYCKLPAEEQLPEPPATGRVSVKELVLTTEEGDIELPRTCCQRFGDALGGHNCEMVSASAAILNAVWVGIQTDYTARFRTKHHPAVYGFIDNLFCWFFVSELTLKICAKGKSFFCKQPENKWNWFDVVVVGSQLLEVCVNALASTTGARMDGSAFTVMRMLRMVRILRVARVASTFGELRKLVMSITASLVPLSWTLLLIFLMTYMFAIMITHIVTERLMHASEKLEEGELLEEFFGTLPKAMTTLYMIISEGIHWGEVMHPLVNQVSPYFRPVICLYVAFQLFAMMNVITAYFVDAAMKSATEDERKEVAEGLLDAFTAAVGKSKKKGETEENMIITKEEFYRVLDHEHMYDFCELLQMDPDDTDIVYDLIDSTGQGRMNTRDFLNGCARLVGPAKAEMTARISFEQRQYWHHAAATQQEILDSLKRINALATDAAKAGGRSIV